MASALQLLVFFLLSLVEVHCQTVTDFQAVASEREVKFSWEAPSVSTPVTGYILSCSPSPSLSPRQFFFETAGTYKQTGFYPDTFYNCSLVAYNEDTTGPPAIVTFSTTKDCELTTGLF